MLSVIPLQGHSADLPVVVTSGDSSSSEDNANVESASPLAYHATKALLGRRKRFVSQSGLEWAGIGEGNVIDT